MARKYSGARCICTGSRSFTYGSSRRYENMMKESSRARPRPILPSDANIITNTATPSKG